MGLPSWDHSAPVGLAWDSNIIRYGASMGLSHHGFEVLPWDPHGTPTTLGASHGISVPPWDWHGIPMKCRTRYGVSMGLSLTMMGCAGPWDRVGLPRDSLPVDIPSSGFHGIPMGLPCGFHGGSMAALRISCDSRMGPPKIKMMVYGTQPKYLDL